MTLDGGPGSDGQVFVLRAVAVAPGCERAYDEAEWRDAIVSVARGEIELECFSGLRHRLRAGDVLWLAGLPVRALHNHGLEPALLVAVSRRSISGRPTVVRS
jgi:quercetin dioxygenase-like cupin family protein